MLRSQRLRFLASALFIASLGLVAAACQGSASEPPPPTAPATIAPNATPEVLEAGVVTLTDTGCTWDGNPGSATAGQLSIVIRNDTDDYGLFLLHRIRDGRTWEEGVAAIETIQEAIRTGADWPEQALEVSKAVGEGAAEGGEDGGINHFATAGTYGVVCSANTSATGDVLTTFLVGPLEVANP